MKFKKGHRVVINLTEEFLETVGYFDSSTEPGNYTGTVVATTLTQARKTDVISEEGYDKTYPIIVVPDEDIFAEDEDKYMTFAKAGTFYSEIDQEDYDPTIRLVRILKRKQL